jgi:hypothetical protein
METFGLGAGCQIDELRGRQSPLDGQGDCHGAPGIAVLRGSGRHPNILTDCWPRSLIEAVWRAVNAAPDATAVLLPDMNHGGSSRRK